MRSSNGPEGVLQQSVSQFNTFPNLGVRHNTQIHRRKHTTSPTLILFSIWYLINERGGGPPGVINNNGQSEPTKRRCLFPWRGCPSRASIVPVVDLPGGFYGATWQSLQLQFTRAISEARVTIKLKLVNLPASCVEEKNGGSAVV